MTTGNELSDGEKRLAKAIYAANFEELDDDKQERFLRNLEDMPDVLRAGLDGDALTKQQVSDGMESTFETMVEDEGIPKEWKDGAAVFAKGVKKRLGLEGSA